MKQTILFCTFLIGLASCTAAKDEAARSSVSKAPAVDKTVVDCALYDGMTKQATALASLSPETQVQVMDTVDAYFVKARITQNGRVLNGYLYRTCFAQ